MFAQEKEPASILNEVSTLIDSVLGNLLTLPVIILILGLVFRKPIRRFFKELIKKFKSGNLSAFEAGAGGVKITFDTSLGSIDASAISSRGDRRDLTTYENGQYGFRISWDDLTYNQDINIAKDMEKMFGQHLGLAIPFYVERREKVENFRPNVNINIAAVEVTETVDRHVHQSVAILKSAGYDVIRTTVDSQSNSAFIEYGKNKFAFQFARITLDRGLAYTITASMQNPILDENAAGAQIQNAIQAESANKILEKRELRKELQTILNSFELTRKQSK